MCDERRKNLRERLGTMMKSMKHTHLTIAASVILLAAASLTACTLGAERTATGNHVEVEDEPVQTEPIGDVLGIWHYLWSTEGAEDDERRIGPSEVNILQVFETAPAPPYLEIFNDGSIRANFVEYEHIAVLEPISGGYAFSVVPEDPVVFESEENIDLLTYIPESELIRYSWPVADIHHYFSRDYWLRIPNVVELYLGFLEDGDVIKLAAWLSVDGDRQNPSSDFIEQAERGLALYGGYDLSSFEIVGIHHSDDSRGFRCIIQDAKGDSFTIMLSYGDGLIMPAQITE